MPTLNNLELDYYINNSDDKAAIMNRHWYILDPTQKAKLTTKICYLFNKRVVMAEADKRSLLAFIYHIMVCGRDFTEDHMSTINVISDRRPHRNPIRMAPGSLVDNHFSSHNNKRDYRALIINTITTKKYDWSIDTVISESTAQAKGVPVDVIVDFDNLATKDDLIQAGSVFSSYFGDTIATKKEIEHKLLIQDQLIDGLLLTVEELTTELKSAVSRINSLEKKRDKTALRDMLMTKLNNERKAG